MNNNNNNVGPIITKSLSSVRRRHVDGNFVIFTVVQISKLCYYFQNYIQTLLTVNFINIKAC